MAVTFLRASFKRIQTKSIVCRDCKRFNQNEFLHELHLEKNKVFLKFFLSTDKHAPIKENKLTDTNTLFMAKYLKYLKSWIDHDCEINI